jgi:hypothetical protein
MDFFDILPVVHLRHFVLKEAHASLLYGELGVTSRGCSYFF